MNELPGVLNNNSFATQRPCQRCARLSIPLLLLLLLLYQV